MPVMIKRKSGESAEKRGVSSCVLFHPTRSSWKCGKKELNSIPRYPHLAIRDWNSIILIESDLFLNLIIDAYAFMVWPYMGLGAKREIYSGYEPSWILAHSPAYWVEALTEAKILPTVGTFLKDISPEEYFGFVPIEEISETLQWLVPLTMEAHNMNAAIEMAKEFRCFEDFDLLYSRWDISSAGGIILNKRTRKCLLNYNGRSITEESHDGQEWDVPDNTTVELNSIAEVQVEQFMATLTDKDRQILILKNGGTKDWKKSQTSLDIKITAAF